MGTLWLCTVSGNHCFYKRNSRFDFDENMEKSDARNLGFVFVLAGLLMIVHHIIVSGRVFDLADVLHHEFFEAILLTAGVVLLLVSFSEK